MANTHIPSQRRGVLGRLAPSIATACVALASPTCAFAVPTIGTLLKIPKSVIPAGDTVATGVSLSSADVMTGVNVGTGSGELVELNPLTGAQIGSPVSLPAGLSQAEPVYMSADASRNVFVEFVYQTATGPFGAGVAKYSPNGSGSYGLNLTFGNGGVRLFHNEPIGVTPAGVGLEGSAVVAATYGLSDLSNVDLTPLDAVTGAPGTRVVVPAPTTTGGWTSGTVVAVSPTGVHVAGGAFPKTGSGQGVAAVETGPAPSFTVQSSNASFADGATSVSAFGITGDPTAGELEAAQNGAPTVGITSTTTPAATTPLLTGDTNTNLSPFGIDSCAPGSGTSGGVLVATNKTTTPPPAGGDVPVFIFVPSGGTQTTIPSPLAGGTTGSAIVWTPDGTGGELFVTNTDGSSGLAAISCAPPPPNCHLALEPMPDERGWAQLYDGRAGGEYRSETLMVSGGTSPYTWTISNSFGPLGYTRGLPPGLELQHQVSGGTNEIAGTTPSQLGPPHPGTASSYAFSFGVMVEDSSSPPCTTSAEYTLTLVDDYQSEITDGLVHVGRVRLGNNFVTLPPPTTAGTENLDVKCTPPANAPCVVDAALETGATKCNKLSATPATAHVKRSRTGPEYIARNLEGHGGAAPYAFTIVQQPEHGSARVKQGPNASGPPSDLIVEGPFARLPDSIVVGIEDSKECFGKQDVVLLPPSPLGHADARYNGSSFLWPVSASTSDGLLGPPPPGVGSSDSARVAGTVSQTLGSGELSLPLGRTSVLRIKLTAAARTLLKHNKRVAARLRGFVQVGHALSPFDVPVVLKGR